VHSQNDKTQVALHIRKVYDSQMAVNQLPRKGLTGNPNLRRHLL